MSPDEVVLNGTTRDAMSGLEVVDVVVDMGWMVLRGPRRVKEVGEWMAMQGYGALGMCWRDWVGWSSCLFSTDAFTRPTWALLQWYAAADPPQ